MFGDDEEILQDFLVEAGEILEQLSEQLVELEQNPEDKDLLNAIFRGFHTVKGGAGFLQLNTLVECCHVIENLFDILRNGQRAVTSDLMDVVLQALDAVNEMFEQVKRGEEPSAADPLLLAALAALVEGDDESVSVQSSVVDTEVAQVSAAVLGDASAQDEGDITDAEFEQFLNVIADPVEKSEPSPVSNEQSQSAASDDITDEEFESLLDEIHGKAKGKLATPAPLTENRSAGSKSETVTNASTSPSQSDEMTEHEFEALLNELHGSGAPSGKVAGPAISNTQAAAESASQVASAQPEDTSNKALISDSEFDNLLDQLHGKGLAPKGVSNGASVVQGASTGDTSKPVAKSHTPASKKAKAKAPAPSKSTSSKQAAAAKESVVTAEATVRVDTQRLDDIMNMVGELVLVRNRLVRLGTNSGDEVMAKAVSNLDVVTADLQTAVMKTRMQPIKKVFGRFPRVVRDLARNLKKEVMLELRGEETDLDKNLVEALADPLVHLVRNSVDHGIELPDVREKAGKSRVGQVILAAEQEGDHILLSITDDGAGMDPDILRKKAIEKGLFDEDSASRLNDSECFDIIFMPGFSTKTEISDVSGRGVGMDVVKTKISQLNGSVKIFSKVGEGTRLEIKVPLTLAIMPTLMVMLGDQTFAFPLVSVNEIFHMDLTRTNIVDGQEVVTVRDKALPLFHLKKWLVGGVGDCSSGEAVQSAHVVIVSVGTQRVGFVVDQLIGQEEVVIKPLGKTLQGTPGMAGATITGDGRIALILDVPSMLNRYAG